MKPYSLKITTAGQEIKAFARIRPCKKRGIKIRAQKTFKMRSVAPTFTSEEMLPAIEAELDRWAAKKLSTVNAL